MPAFIYSHLFNSYSYGDDHPFNVQRYRLTYDLISELGLLDCASAAQIECVQADEKALLCFHRQDYLDTLANFSRGKERRANFFYGLGDVENPVFEGLYDWARLVCGGSLQAARLVAEEGTRIAFNMAGGWHHAHPARASGFSYLNDAVIAIHYLLQRGLRIAYVDIDAHHGDGVQDAFYDSDRVLTISLHEGGKDFFPHTGFPAEMGRGKGYGYSVNVPFIPHSDDLIFEQAFVRVVEPLLRSFKPDVLVTQMGADILRTDPLSRLEMTTGSIELAARSFRQMNIPWIVLGGGGYDKVNVARAWTLVWAILNETEISDDLPSRFRSILSELGDRTDRLRDLPHLAHPDDFARAQKALEKNLSILERRLLPLHGISLEAPR